MTGEQWFVLIGGIVGALIVGYDIYLAVRYGFSGTISWWIWTNSTQYPIIAAGISLITGVLLGHYYWNLELAVVLIVGVLFGHWFWDQELNVTVAPESDTPPAAKVQP